MGILATIYFLLFFVPGAIIGLKNGSFWSLLLIVCSATTIPLVLLGGYDVPSQYQFESKINLDGYTTTVYFEYYEQNNDVVLIDEYAVINSNYAHWTDFNKYDVITDPLLITIQSRSNKFVYKNRYTGEVFNETETQSIATQ
jgi:hypothetical protein